jgi:hypothetical protein
MARDRKYDAPDINYFPAEDCDECGELIDTLELAPSCGAHRLHLGCRGHFDCRYCNEEWADANQ